MLDSQFQPASYGLDKTNIFIYGDIFYILSDILLIFDANYKQQQRSGQRRTFLITQETWRLADLCKILSVRLLSSPAKVTTRCSLVLIFRKLLFLLRLLFISLGLM